jgi:hypothetical protein
MENTVPAAGFSDPDPDFGKNRLTGRARTEHRQIHYSCTILSLQKKTRNPSSADERARHAPSTRQCVCSSSSPG